MKLRKSIFRTAAAGAFLASMCVTALGQAKAFDKANMNTAVDACTDFFEFANGGWLKKTEIPASESRWGTFNVLADRNNAMLKEILESAAKSKAAEGSNEQLIGDFYATCMDEAGIEKAGITPIKRSSIGSTRSSPPRTSSGRSRTSTTTASRPYSPSASGPTLRTQTRFCSIRAKAESRSRTAITTRRRIRNPSRPARNSSSTSRTCSSFSAMPMPPRAPTR